MRGELGLVSQGRRPICPASASRYWLAAALNWLPQMGQTLA